MSISKKRQWRNLQNAFQIKTLFPLKKKKLHPMSFYWKTENKKFLLKILSAFNFHLEKRKVCFFPNGTIFLLFIEKEIFSPICILIYSFRHQLQLSICKTWLWDAAVRCTSRFDIQISYLSNTDWSYIFIYFKAWKEILYFRKNPGVKEHNKCNRRKSLVKLTAECQAQHAFFWNPKEWKKCS